MLIQIERKSFEMVMMGREGDCLKITESNGQRRNTVILTRDDMKWLEAVWKEFWEGEKTKGWFRRRRAEGRTLLLQTHANKWGRMVILSVLKGGIYQSVICPEGQGQQGWKSWAKAMEEISAKKKVNTIQKSKTISNMIDDRSWRDVVGKSQRLEGRATNRVDREIPVEMCCGNCGWKLSGTFKTTVERRGISNEAGRLNQQGMQIQETETMNSNQGVGVSRELDKENRFLNFEKSNSKKSRVGPVYCDFLRSPIATKKTKVDITTQRMLSGKITATGTKQKTVVNREVHRWVQKNKSFSDNQSARQNEVGKANMMDMQVYRRRGNPTNQRKNESIGVILREKSPVTGRKKFIPIEFIKKMKGIQSNEEGSNTKDDEELSLEGNWERGECSNQIDDEERMALIPVSTEGEANSEGRSQASWESNGSRRSLDIWSSLKGSALEEQAGIWIMRNLVYMGKSLGPTWEGSKVKTLQITQGEVGGQSEEETTSKGTRGRTKVLREINRLKSEINYERRGSKGVRKRIKLGKVRKGGKLPCQ